MRTLKNGVLRSMGLSGALPMLAALHVLGCSAGDSPAHPQPATSGFEGKAESSAESSSALAALIRNVSVEGDWCPPVPDGRDARPTVSVQGSAVQINPLESAVHYSDERQTCTVTVDLEIPAGYQLGPLATILRGFSDQGMLKRTYSFEGAGSLPPLVSELSDDYTLEDVGLDGLWSPSCDGQTSVRFRAKFEPSVTAQRPAPGTDPLPVIGSPELSVRGLLFQTALRDGAKWRACDGTLSDKPVPGALGEVCEGPQARTCGAGLVCGHSGPNRFCIDPTQPSGLMMPCGGPLAVACVNDALCLYESQKDADQQGWGICRDRTIPKGAYCNTAQVPARECEAGLRCVLQAAQTESRCRPLTGKLNDACDDAFPCEAGLACEEGICFEHYSYGTLGASCAEDNQCQANLRCLSISGSGNYKRCLDPNKAQPQTQSPSEPKEPPAEQPAQSPSPNPDPSASPNDSGVVPGDESSEPGEPSDGGEN